jgi:hypothetical protein
VDVGYAELAKRLTDMGLPESEGSVTVKINRGGVSSVVLLRSHEGRWNAFGKAARAGLIGLITAACCSSQPVSAKPHEHPEGSQAKTAQTSDGPSRPPIIIQVQPSPEEVEAIAEKEAAKARIFGLEPDTWVAIFTLALTISTVLMWLETRRLAAGGEDQHGTLKRSVKAARMAALAALKSAKIAKAQLAASHPPKIIIRRISLHEGTPRFAPIGRPWKIEYIIANIGGAKATIYELNATIFCPNEDESLPAIPPYQDGGDVTGEWYLEAGQSHPFDVFLTEDQISAAGREWNDTSEPKATHFYLIGYVQYRDAADVVRRTAFARRLDRKIKRFKAIEDPDYEYN